MGHVQQSYYNYNDYNYFAFVKYQHNCESRSWNRSRRVNRFIIYSGYVVAGMLISGGVGFFIAAIIETVRYGHGKYLDHKLHRR